MGYAGSRHTSADGLVCYHGGPRGSLYEDLGQGEAVQVQLDGTHGAVARAQFAAILNYYFTHGFTSSNRVRVADSSPFPAPTATAVKKSACPPPLRRHAYDLVASRALQRLDPQDSGPAYRSAPPVPARAHACAHARSRPVLRSLPAQNLSECILSDGAPDMIGLPGGMQGPLYSVVTQVGFAACSLKSLLPACPATLRLGSHVAAQANVRNMKLVAGKGGPQNDREDECGAAPRRDLALTLSPQLAA